MRWGGIAIWLVILAQVGHAQREGGGATVDSVLLDTDTQAAKKLGAARDLLAARQWDDGIELVRQIAELHAGRMVAIGPRRYVSVATYCDNLLSSLPDAGLKLYRARVDEQARQWFEAGRSGHDEQGLRKIVERAFLSSYGDDALLVLGQLAWERGMLPQARSYWELLLPLDQPPEAGQLPPVLRYPAGDADAAQIRARLVLCSFMQGETQRGQRELEEFRRLHPQATGTIGGRTGNLAEILKGQAALADRQSLFPVEAQVQTFAGNTRRNQVQLPSVDVGSVQWSANLPPVKTEIAARSEEPERLRIFDRGPAALAQDVLCYFPLVAGNLVLYCDETAVYAHELLSAEPGKPAWGTDPVIYKLPADLIVPKDVSARRAGLPRYTMSVDGDRVFAHLGSTAPRGRHRAVAETPSLLVCLDLGRQGDLVWSVRPDDVQEANGHWTFDGAPLASAGRVFVTLRRREPQLQLNVACLDAATGKPIWNQKVCLGLEHFGPETAEINHQLLTLADERLFYCTNRGAIAALEAADGAPRWVTTYPRADVESVSAFNKRQLHGPNPCLYHDGQVFVAPTDSNQVLAYDAETGLLQWDRDLKGNMHQLVGVTDGRLIVAGDALVALDTEAGRIEWKAAQAMPEGGTRGRCAIGGNLIYWPRREELLLVDSASGKFRREIDLKEQHGLHGGGNITLTDGFLLLGQTDGIVVFSEFGTLRKRREEEVTNRPDDPRAHYELALLAEAMQEPDVARISYHRALDLASTADNAETRRQKERTGERLSPLLLRLGEEALSSNQADKAGDLFQEAANVAPSVEQRLAAWRALAHAHEAGEDPAGAVVAWQQVLEAAAGGRDLSDSDLLSAARQARTEIDQLVDRHGKAAYRAIERLAQSELNGALQRRDRKETAALLARFPNAQATARAALQLASVERESGNLYAADRIYKGILESHQEGDARGMALAGLALNAEARRAWLSAQRWWERLYEKHARETISVGGLTRLVVDVAPERIERLRQTLRLPTGGPDDSAVPWLRRWDKRLPSESDVLVPEGNPPSDELDGVVIVGENVSWISTEDGLERWQIMLSEPPVWSAFVADALVLGTETTACGIAPDDGRVLWQRSFLTNPGHRPLDRLSFRATGDRLNVLSSAGGIWSLYGETGETAWRFHPRRGVLQAHWQANAGRIIVQRLAPDRWDVLDARDGTVVADGPGPATPWRDDPVPLTDDRWLTFADSSGVPQLVDLPQGTARPFGETALASVCVVTDRPTLEGALVAAADPMRLTGFDPVTGGRLWSCRAGDEPLSTPRRAACQDQERLFVITGGVVRCHALDNGKLLWEQYVGPRGEWHIARRGPALIVWRAATDDRATVLLCDPATGAFVSRLGGGPARSVQVHADRDRAIVHVDSLLIGYQARSAIGD